MATHSSILAWGKSHGQRSLVGYSLWGLRESDTTEQQPYMYVCLCLCVCVCVCVILYLMSHWGNPHIYAIFSLLSASLSTVFKFGGHKNIGLY